MSLKKIKIILIIPIVMIAFTNCNRSELLTKIQEIQGLIDTSKKAITEFQFLAADNPALTTTAVSTIDESAKTIDITVPFGTDVTGLIATFTLSGGVADILGTTQESGVTINDFSASIIYTVTAADATTADYLVTVSIALNSDKQLTQIKFLETKNPSLSADVIGVIDEGTKKVNLSVPFSADETNLIATFSITGAELRIGAVIQMSDVTSNNYSSPVVYTVEAADGSTADYTVTVTKLPATSNKVLTDFRFLASNNGALSQDIEGEIDELAKSVEVYMPHGTAVTSLKATFIIDGHEVKVGGITQTSGVTANDFTSTVFYTIVAEDNSTKDYSVDIIFVYLREGFEYDLSQWSINGTNNYTYQGLSSPGADGTATCLEQTGYIYNHTSNFTKVIGPTQINYVSFYIKFATSGGSRGYVTLTDSANKFVIFFAGVGTKFSPSDGSNYWGSQTIVLDKWYHVEFTNFNWSAKTHDYYCDGVLMYSGAPFRDAGLVTEVKQINLYNWDDSTVYFDEIIIY